MSKKILPIIALICILIMLAGCSAATPPPSPTPEPTVASPEGKILVMGQINDKPIEEIEQWQPLADFLAANLSEFGITGAEVKVSPNPEVVADWLKTGEADFFIDSAYAAIRVSDASGGQFIAYRIKDGPSERRSIFATRMDSSLTALTDLQGQIIALEEPDSTSGCLLPLGTLLEAGLKAVEKESIDSSVAADEIGYVFSGDDDNTAIWVSEGRVAAGAMDDDHFEEFTEENPGILTSLFVSESVPRAQLVGVAPQLDPALVEALKELLLKMHEIEAAQDAIETAETLRFDDFAEESGIVQARQMYKLIQDQ